MAWALEAWVRQFDSVLLDFNNPTGLGGLAQQVAYPTRSGEVVGSNPTSLTIFTDC